MFIKSLKIFCGNGSIIRDIEFHMGLNLIVDETPTITGKETGNNVGKTTVLKLVDFCLGGDLKNVYVDHENKKNEYKIVKDYLVNYEVYVSLTLKKTLDEKTSEEVTITRNFLKNSKKMQSINGEKKTKEEFNKTLTEILFTEHYGKKPTFRQIIAHNIRYRDSSLNNTLKHLNEYTRLDEYEALYLFLLGCRFDRGDIRQQLRSQIAMEQSFKKRLESEQTKSAYEVALNILEEEIEELEKRKSLFKTSSNVEKKLSELNKVKYNINTTLSEINRLELRKNLILEAKKDLESNIANIDLEQLHLIYKQAKFLIHGIQKTFDDLYRFHNKMIEVKSKFISQDLPRIDFDISSKINYLNSLLVEKNKLSNIIYESNLLEDIEENILMLNEKYRKKGEYENILNQINDVNSRLNNLNLKLTDIDNEIFSDEFSHVITEQLNKFNKFFSSVSHELYGEKYALKFDIRKEKDHPIYEFKTFNINFSSGKKQGEIACFDIAYILFADEENIPCMHFLLNDKKELMHDNQLVKIANLVNRKNIQFISSILRDKLPEEINKKEYIIAVSYTHLTLPTSDLV